MEQSEVRFTLRIHYKNDFSLLLFLLNNYPNLVIVRWWTYQKTIACVWELMRGGMELLISEFNRLSFIYSSSQRFHSIRSSLWSSFLSNPSRIMHSIDWNKKEWSLFGFTSIEFNYLWNRGVIFKILIILFLFIFRDDVEWLTIRFYAQLVDSARSSSRFITVEGNVNNFTKYF